MEFETEPLHKRWYSKTYLIDYAMIIFFLLPPAILNLSSILPRKRYVPSNRPAFQYPLLDDIVPLSVALIVSMIISLSIIFLRVILQSKKIGFLKEAYDKNTSSVHLLHSSLVCLLFSVSLTLLFGETIKYTVGFNRPDYFARTEGTSNWKDGMLSFPSGHSSFTFAVMVFCFLFLSGQFHLFNKTKKVLLPLYFIICFCPFAFSTFVSISRIIDYHHHPADVIGGGILGTIISYIVYFLYFPKLTSKDCHIPLIRK